VTACLTIQCHGASTSADLTSLLDLYHSLDTATPGLAVFRMRLGLSFVDALGTIDDAAARQIAADTIDYAATTRDGYAARDVLAHDGCRELLTHNQTRELIELVDACALGRGRLPASLLEDLTHALASAEEVMARSMIAPAVPLNVHTLASPQ
jgi:hypothetical protein